MTAVSIDSESVLDELRDSGLFSAEELAAFEDSEPFSAEEIAALVERVVDLGALRSRSFTAAARALIAAGQARSGIVAAAPPIIHHVDTAPQARGRVPLAELAKRQPESSKAPTHEGGPRTLPALVATAGGAPLDGDLDSIAAELSKALGRLPDAANGKHLVCSWSTHYPTAQRLSPTPDLHEVSALIATGGLCAPTTVRYELETVAVSDRPLRAGLPSFNADRGGIQFNSPAHLVDVLADQASAALTTVTVAQDVSAVTKSVQEVSCGTLQTVQVRAIADRLQFTNFADRYQPERMQQWITLSLASHSRLCERELFEDMQTASTLVNGGAVWVGATRQWVNNVLVAARAMRYRHRMADAYPLRIVLPRWFVTMVACDLVLQAPGDGTIVGQFDAEQIINRWLSVENIRPIWHLDDARTNNALGAGGPAFAAQTGSGATLNDFPGRMVSLMFPEGSFLFLDGGSLDFGIVRDSTLNATNRFQTFMEVFEAVAFGGRRITRDRDAGLRIRARHRRDGLDEVRRRRLVEIGRGEPTDPAQLLHDVN